MQIKEKATCRQAYYAGYNDGHVKGFWRGWTVACSSALILFIVIFFLHGFFGV